MDKREKYPNHPYKVLRTKKYHEVERRKPVIATERIEIFPTVKDGVYKLFLDEKFIDRVYNREGEVLGTEELINDFFVEFVDVASADFPDKLYMGFTLEEPIVQGFTTLLHIERKGESFEVGMDVSIEYTEKEISESEFTDLLRVLSQHSSRYGFRYRHVDDDVPFALLFCDIPAGKTIGEMVNETARNLEKLIDDAPLYDNNGDR